MKVYVASFCTSDDIIHAVEEDSFDPLVEFFQEEGVLFPQFSLAFAEFGKREIATLKRNVIEYVNAFADEELGESDFEWSDSGWLGVYLPDSEARPNRSIVGKSTDVDVFIGVQQAELG
jgi:hypothetical protein